MGGGGRGQPQTLQVLGSQSNWGGPSVCVYTCMCLYVYRHTCTVYVYMCLYVYRHICMYMYGGVGCSRVGPLSVCVYAWRDVAVSHYQDSQGPEICSDSHVKFRGIWLLPLSPPLLFYLFTAKQPKKNQIYQTDFIMWKA